MEVKVSRIIADIAVCVLDTSQHVCVIADVSSVLTRELRNMPSRLSYSPSRSLQSENHQIPQV